MLKRRIIPIELLDGGRLIKTVGFSNPRDVGDPVKSSQVYSDQDADELVLLNISRIQRDIAVLNEVVLQIACECFVPFTVGGGIACLDDASQLFDAGADKVLVNSAVYSHPDLISEISTRYGQQAVVVGIDARLGATGFELFSDCGRRYESASLAEHIIMAVEAGAGEIMIQSIERDGTMLGYDLNLIKSVVALSPLPLIVAGGAGDFTHLKQAFDLGADAAACGSLFNFGDNNPLRAKAFLKNYNIPLKRI
ncbi:MAG: imidazole glycerol phosphate synthase subunit HisF [Chlorobium sp.]